MLKKALCLALLLMMGFLPTSQPLAVQAQADASPVLLRWRAAQSDFSNWTLQNLEETSDGALRLIEPTGTGEPPASIFLGEATSPIVENLLFQEAIASWNAQTPAGTWMDLLLRVREGEQWSEWFYMGIWSASTEGTVLRHSVTDQQDAISQAEMPERFMTLCKKFMLCPIKRACSFVMTTKPPAAMNFNGKQLLQSRKPIIFT